MWKIFPIYSFLYLFQRKWLIVEEKSYLSIFWNFQTQFCPQNHSHFFLFPWDYQKLSKIFILQEKFVSSWIYLEESLLKPLDIIIFALKMKLTLSTTHITKVKNTLNMHNDRKVNKLSETFCFWKLLGIRFSWLIYIFVYWVIFELNQKFCDIFFTKRCYKIVNNFGLLQYYDSKNSEIIDYIIVKEASSLTSSSGWFIQAYLTFCIHRKR